MADRYDIYFSGQIMEGRDPEQVKDRIGRLFGADTATLERLFSGASVRIKAGVDQETAVRYRVAIRDTGALVDIRPAQKETSSDSAQTATPETATSSMTLLPPRSGSLIDCAKPVAAAPLPDISDLELCSPGVSLDESSPPDQPTIDTSGLTLAPARSGTLEDCHVEAEPTSIGDISHLQLDDE